MEGSSNGRASVEGSLVLEFRGDDSRASPSTGFRTSPDSCAAFS